MSAAAIADDRFLTCILPKGKGSAVLQALFDRKVARACLGSARAPVTVEKRKGGFTRAIHHSVEKDILTVIVASEEAEEIFQFIHETAGMADLYGGFMFMGRLGKASPFTLPADLPRS